MSARRHGAVIAIVFAALVLAAFAAWSVRLLIGVADLRDAVDERVAALAAIDRLERGVRTGTVAQSDLAVLEDAARAQTREADGDPALGQAMVSAARAATEGTGRDATAEKLRALAPELRSQWASLSTDLADRWDSVALVVAAALAFGASSLGLLVWGRFVALARTRAETERLQVLAERLAGSAPLATTVAHGINNPLSSVTANLELLRELLGGANQPGSAEALRLVEEALAGTERVVRLARDLRSMSQELDQTEDAIDVNEVIDAVIATAVATHPQPPEIQRSYVGNAFVRGSIARLRQVLDNLVANALESFERAPGRAHRLELRTRKTGDDTIVVEVRDDGPGVPQEVMARLFEPFVGGRGGHTGIGLFVCARVVESLRGTIHVDSGADGTRVRIELPAARDAARHLEMRPTPEAMPAVERSRRLRVLVVDDDELVARTLARLLREHDVTVCISGEDALVVGAADAYDVVVCDVTMPDVDGLAVFEGLVAKNPDYRGRFAFMSGAVFEAGLERSIVATGCPVLEKPLRIEDVREMIATTMQRVSSAPSVVDLARDDAPP